MNQYRDPSSQERAIIATLLQATPEATGLISTLSDLVVQQMDDGGMGSLSLVPKGTTNTDRALGQQLVSGEFTDLDGVPVSITINVDCQGKLYELDVWKANFAPLLAWPDPSRVRIVK